jgi:tRNA A-37 threonylcarbamoyl transferase component Bud32
VSVPLAPDTTIADRYVFEQRIAVGGMGEVWRARDPVLSRTVAVKVLKAEYAADPAFLSRFRDEARHTAGLSHPGIANVFDYGEIGDPATGCMAYLVMEHVAGEPLSAVLAREGRLAPERTLDIVGQAALALQAAHDAGVVHRDVKPGNLLLRPDGVVKVTDFGIARAVNAAPVTQTGFVVGTAAYLSPEQAAGKPVTAASDIYSLGVVAYECLAGVRPFDNGSAVADAMAHINTQPPALPKDTPAVVTDFVMRALDKDPDRRHRSAGDFGRTALALATTLRTTPAETAATGPAHPPTKLLPAVADTPAETAADDGERRRIRNIFIGIGAAVVLLGFLLLRACAPGASTPPQPGKPTASATPTAATVAVAQAQYVGQPVDKAKAELTALGFVVRVTSVTSTAPAGSVVAVTPTGNLRRGSTVTLTKAVAPAPPPKHHGKHKGGPGGD